MWCLCVYTHNTQTLAYTYLCMCMFRLYFVSIYMYIYIYIYTFFFLYLPCSAFVHCAISWGPFNYTMVELQVLSLTILLWTLFYINDKSLKDSGYTSLLGYVFLLLPVSPQRIHLPSPQLILHNFHGVFLQGLSCTLECRLSTFRLP